MDNYVITGSLGNISKPIIEGLIKQGKKVSVITSNNDRSKEIEHLGAKPLVGQLQDLDFLKKAFTNADVVYTMIPPIWQTTNWRASQNEVARNYTSAIESAGVKFVVNLSSLGADKPNGIGPVSALYEFEQMLNKIPGLNVRHLRPSYFYHNLIAQIGLIKQAGFMGSNFGEGEKLFLVHPADIAKAALEELSTLNFKGNSVRYVISDERSGKEIAEVLGKAINKPLQWVVFTDEQQKQGLLQAGLSETHTAGYVEMGKALREGYMQEDARKNKPVLSKIKLEDFSKEFSEAFNNAK
jgi:uncharacterized protein YbjT (DUF2867 family)